MKFILHLTAVAAAGSGTDTFNLAIINDIHLNPNATSPTISLCNIIPFCKSDLSVYASETTPKLLDEVIVNID
jgi:hypothetical protein